MAVHISAHEVADARRQISVHDQPYILTDYIGAAPRRGQYVAGNCLLYTSPSPRD